MLKTQRGEIIGKVLKVPNFEVSYFYSPGLCVCTLLFRHPCLAYRKEHVLINTNTKKSNLLQFVSCPAQEKQTVIRKL